MLRDLSETDEQVRDKQTGIKFYEINHFEEEHESSARANLILRCLA